jgi:hypothetical protein
MGFSRWCSVSTSISTARAGSSSASWPCDSAPTPCSTRTRSSKPLTLDDYSTPADLRPARLFDCVMPRSGAHGVLVSPTTPRCPAARAPRARSSRRTTPIRRPPRPCRAVSEAYADELPPPASAAATSTPASSTTVTPSWLHPAERYGFCDEGRGAEFIGSTDVSITASRRSSPAAASSPAGRASRRRRHRPLTRHPTAPGRSRRLQVVDAETALGPATLVSYGKGPAPRAPDRARAA